MSVFAHSKGSPRLRDRLTGEEVLGWRAGGVTMLVSSRASGWRWGMDKRRLDPVKVGVAQ